MRTMPVQWSELPTDYPIPKLTRTKLETENTLVAKVHLDKGCNVQRHRHVSEQISIMLKGHARWTLGNEGDTYEVEHTSGSVIHLPSNFPHGLIALEDCEIIDILNPPGAMGVDSQDGK